MSKVLFGQSYYLRFDPKLWEAMQPYPPLGTLWAASTLRRRGYDVGLFDAMLAGSELDWAAALDRDPPRFAVLYEDSFNYLTKMCLLRMREAAFTMIRMARERGATVIVSGSDASDRPELYLDQGADYVIIGEGEVTLGELLDRLTERSAVPFASIPGLAFADLERPGRTIRTAHRPVITVLDDLPFPAWDLVDVPRYQRAWRQRHGYYSMNLVTTRGCPFTCNWCAKPIWGQTYHSRSPENVVQELQWLTSAYHPDAVWFADDIMGLEPGWIERFADLVERADIRLPFKSLHRADLLLQGDAIGALARAGATTVWIGAESGSQKILDLMDKGTRVEQIYRAARLLHAAGIEVCFFVQFGYPGEEWEDIVLTRKMIRDCSPDDIGISVSYPLPGTKFFDSVRGQLGDQRNWKDSSDLAMLHRGPFSTAFYRRLHSVLHKEFRSRKIARALGRAALRPWVWRRGHARRAAAMLFYTAILPFERLRLSRLRRTGPEEIGAVATGTAEAS
jgi:anaerobic magnesium-protoporphyrin IX monomethyl ester cyclase